MPQRLRNGEERRPTLLHELQQSNTEKELCLKHIEIGSAAHETQMHSVIAELKKKLSIKLPFFHNITAISQVALFRP